MQSKTYRKLLDKIFDWFVHWKLELNYDKCGAIFYSPTNVSILLTVKLNRREIPWLSKYKYLGFNFDRRLAGTVHIGSVLQRVKVLLDALGSLLKRNSVLSTDNKLLIYKAVVLPILTYGYPAITVMKGYNINSLCTLQNKIIRNIAGLNYDASSQFAHDCLGFQSIPTRIQELFTKELEKLDEHPNGLLHKAISYSLSPVQDFSRPRHFLV